MPFQTLTRKRTDEYGESMHRAPDRRLRSPKMLLVLAVFTLFGHVCVPPVHAHELPLGVHAEGEWHKGTPPPGAGSCEALAGSTDDLVIAAGELASVIDTLVPSAPARIVRLPEAAPPPLLFLLHASLLI